MMFQIGYVGSEGHRLLASYDINPSIPQTCLDITSIANANAAQCELIWYTGNRADPFLEDSQWSVTVPNGFPFHMPSGAS